jgi:surface antigen
MSIFRRYVRRGAAVSLIAALLLLFVLPLAALASDDYPYKNDSWTQADPWLFYKRECTSFVAWRMNHNNGVAFTNYMKGGHWGNASNWDNNAVAIGYPVNSTPAVGAIAQWNGGEGGAGSVGHVAWVERVNSDGSVVIEEYNWSNPHGYSTRTVRAPRYIHVKDISGPTYSVSGTDGAGLNVRTQPTSSASLVTNLPEGTPVQIVCQLYGQDVHGSKVWDKIDNPASGYVSDYYISGTQYAVFTPGIPQCGPNDQSPPGGALTSPPSGSSVEPGQQITVSGDFTDDVGVTKVDFYVTDDSYQWRPIGSDGHGGNGVYSVTWTVDYPLGANLHFHAHAFDAAGHEAISSVTGLDNVLVSTPAPITHDRSIGLNLRRHLRAFGSITLVDDYSQCVQAATVVVQRRTDGHWKTKAWLTSDSAGAFGRQLSDKTGRYRAVALGMTVWEGTQEHTCNRAVSQVIRHTH